MKKILILLFFPIISFSQISKNLNEVKTFRDMGDYCFDIQNNIDSYSIQDFINKLSDIDTVSHIVKTLKKENNTEDLERYYNYLENLTRYNLENEMSDSFKYFIEQKEELTQLKKKGRFRFLDFSVNRKSFDGLELYNLWIEYEIIGRPKEIRQDLCFLFFIHDERFYLLGFD